MLVQAALRTAEAFAAGGVAVGVPGAAVLQVSTEQTGVAGFMPPSPVLATTLALPPHIRPDAFIREDSVVDPQARFARHAAGATVNSTEATRPTRNFGGSFAASTWHDWVSKTHAIMAARRKGMAGADAHILPTVERALELFEEHCGATLADAVLNHPATHRAAAEGKDCNVFGSKVYAMEFEFAAVLIRNILGSLRVVSSSRYVSSDRSLRIFSSTSPLLSTEYGSAFYCDIDETLVSGFLIRPAVPIVFDFLKWLLGEEVVSIGLLSSRSRDWMLRQLDDPKIVGTLFELGPLLDRDKVFVVSDMSTTEIGYLMCGGKSPYALEELMGWDKRRVDRFWAKDFDKIILALAELNALSGKMYGRDEIRDIYSISNNLRCGDSNGDDAVARVREHPKFKRIAEKLAAVSVDEDEIRRALAQTNCWFDTKETDPRTVADQLLETMMQQSRNILATLRPESYDTAVVRRVLIGECPALKAWVRRHKRELKLIDDLNQAMDRKKAEVTKLAEDADRLLERAQYLDGTGKLVPLGLNVYNMSRWLHTVHYAPPHQLAFVLDNMRQQEREAFYHLMIARNVFDPETGLPVDPNELFNIALGKRDMVYMVPVRDFSV